jgi:hypothetical protein
MSTLPLGSIVAVANTRLSFMIGTDAKKVLLTGW